jgi:tartrate/fumarate subfamily iron-sulfur-dependent hydro-lyase beta chain
MTEKIVLKVPTTAEKVRELKAGSEVYLTGVVHNMRASLLRLARMAEKGEKIPDALKVGLEGGAIHYGGPIIDRKNRVLSAASTTTGKLSMAIIGRLVKDFNIRLFISKEGLGAGAADLLKEQGAAYLATVVGAGAWYAYPRVKRIQDIFWEDLGMGEACYVMEVENFGPLWVGIDAHGNSLYEDTKQIIKENKKKIYTEMGWKL